MSTASRARNAEAEPAGYRHPAYAAALAEFGRPRELTGAGGWLLERPVPGAAASDAVGCYPLFCCSDWTSLATDLESLGDLVSVAVVPDPFVAFDEELLRRTFDVVRGYKDHLVVDAAQPASRPASRMHRRNIARGRKTVEVELCRHPGDQLAEWVELYSALVRRHEISGVRAFSPEAFALQFAVPGLQLFRATVDGQTVAMLLWYVDDSVAYAHLAAATDLGYDTRALYALYDVGIEALREQVRWIDLGSAPDERDDDGLLAFKRAWATGTRPAYLCGKILQPDVYDSLRAGVGDTDFFPAYRAS